MLIHKPQTQNFEPGKSSGLRRLTWNRSLKTTAPRGGRGGRGGDEGDGPPWLGIMGEGEVGAGKGNIHLLFNPLPCVAAVHCSALSSIHQCKLVKTMRQ